MQHYASQRRVSETPEKTEIRLQVCVRVKEIRVKERLCREHDANKSTNFVSLTLVLYLHLSHKLAFISKINYYM